MKIRKVLATSVLTTAALIQAAMPAFAAGQSNGSTIDQPAAHTQFGIIESTKDVSGQVSFEVPLYVTMAAVSNKNRMAVPSKNAYYIENTSKSIINADGVEEPTEPIGVTNMEVVGLDGGWSIVATEPGDFTTKDDKKAHEMTFTLGKEVFKPMDATGQQTIYDNSVSYAAETIKLDKDGKYVADQLTGDDTKVAMMKGVDKLGWRDKTNSTQFVEYVMTPINLKTTQKVGQETLPVWTNTKLVKIGKGANKLKLDMVSFIGKGVRDDKATTGVFKVVYTLAALDDYGQPRTAAVYAGDNWKDAGYTEDQNKN